MKITILQDVLVDGLQDVLGPATSKQNLPVLNSVLIETQKDSIKLTTTDLDITIQSFLKAKILKAGRVLIPLKKLLSIIRELPEREVSVELHKNNLLIRCETIEFKISTLSPEEFPQTEPIKETTLIKINPQELFSMIKLTSFCVGYEDANYVLSGILFEVYENQICAASTDGKRLAYIKRKLPPTQTELKTKLQFILPIRVVHEIQKLIKEEEEDIFFFTKENRVGFDLRTTQVFARPIEGEFPNYNQFLPKTHQETLTVDRKQILAALRRAALLTTADYQGVKLDLQKNEIVVSKTTPQQGEVTESLPCTYGGKRMQVGFNPNYLIDVLKNIETETVVFEFLDVDKPAVLRQEDYVYLVLPMKI